MELVNIMYTVFISACNKACDASENKTATNSLEHALKGASRLGFIPAQGVYKGSKEESFVGHVTSMQHVAELLELSKLYEQESILVVDSNDSAFLFYTDGAIEYLGTMYSQKLMGNELDLGRDSYTIVPSINRVYYTV